jgi:hypothetical protein
MLSPGRFVAVAILATFCSRVAIANPISIDPPLPAGPVASGGDPWHSLASQPVITYVFDGDIAWLPEQKAASYAAIQALDAILPLNAFEEEGDFSIRWAGAGFFTDWTNGGAYSDPGWNITDALAVAYKHNNGPWDPGTYPNNEIYFNTKYSWSFSILSVAPDKYDFWSVLLHEIIHMLSCDTHATHENEVMYATIGVGQRKYLQDSDYDILRRAGYTLIPEPAPLALCVSAIALLAIGGLRPRGSRSANRSRPRV